MLEVYVNSTQDLNDLVCSLMQEDANWMKDFNDTKRLLVKFPMEIGPHGHGWYSCAPGAGDPDYREWYVKASTLEWAICAGALASQGSRVVYVGKVPFSEPPLS